MAIEAVQDQVHEVILFSRYLTPFLILNIVVCGLMRRARWIAPFWIFAICPVLVIFVLLLVMVVGSTGGSGPDFGYIVMATMFNLLLSLVLVIPGGILLLAFPRGPAWGSHSLVPCVIAAVVSLATCLIGLPYVARLN